MIRILALSALMVTGSVLATPTTAQERSLTLSNVHICCPACTKAIQGAIDKVELVSVEIDQKEKTVKLTGEEGVTRQDAIEALTALADAGFYGTSDKQQFKMKDESEGLSGKVDSLRLIGIHNCCGACNKAITSVVAKVDGTDELKLDKNARDFTVTGDFDSAALVKAINKAGFYVKVKKAE